MPFPPSLRALVHTPYIVVRAPHNPLLACLYLYGYEPSLVWGTSTSCMHRPSLFAELFWTGVTEPDCSSHRLVQGLRAT